MVVETFFLAMGEATMHDDTWEVNDRQKRGARAGPGRGERTCCAETLALPYCTMRLFDRLALLAVPALAMLTACGTTPTPAEMSPSAESNMPSAPQIDRTKCSDKGKDIVTADTNEDKKPDVWKFFQVTNQGGQKVEVLTCKQVDLNHDGKIDIVYYYDDKGQQTTLEEFDLDFDGKFDMTVYYANGKKVREELDTNYDQKPDLFKYYEDEKLVRIERDTNNDGKIDEWQYFEAGKLDRIGYDTAGTGKVDKWDRSPEADETPPEQGGPAPAAATPPAGAKPAATTPPTTAPAPATAPPPAAGTKPKPAAATPAKADAPAPK
jgi:hypothetical protein